MRYMNKMWIIQMEGSVVNIDVGKLLVREFDGESMS